MATASRFERAQTVAWARPARDGGALQCIREALIEVNRGRSLRRINDRITEFAGRETPKDSCGCRSSYSRNPPGKRSEGGRYPGSPIELHSDERTTEAARWERISAKARRKWARNRRNRAPGKINCLLTSIFGSLATHFRLQRKS